MRNAAASRSLTFCFAIAAVVAAGCSGPADESPPTSSSAERLRVSGGELDGVRLESGVMSFRGIPYAAPPVGDLRWRPPQLASAWEGTRAAHDFSANCWQPFSPADSFYGAGEIERSEDCLYLNVWTAAESSDEKRPVMVWIHGGALRTGSGSKPSYDGESFALRGVVLVTVNYRLGPMGFLAHPALSAENDPPSSGNYGILDQVAALRWVNENIHHFGGDVNRITIFGESAGSWSVNYLTATPLAAGLFQRAIGHSGGIFSTMPKLTDGKGSSESQGEALAVKLGAVDAEGLRDKTPEEIYAATVSAGPGRELGPTTDGWVFPKDVYDIFLAGEQNDVDTIVGFNADEGSALFAGAVPADLDGYQTWLADNYGDFADEFGDVYPASNGAEAKVAGYENMADRFFAWQMRTWARLQTKTGSKPVRMYFFSRVPPWEEAETYGTYHAAEILYAFDNLDKGPEMRDQIGPFNHPWEDTDRELARTMSSYWIHFATTGDPNGEGLPKWPVYDTSTDAALNLGDQIEVVNQLWKDRLDVFDAYYHSLRNSS